VAIGCGGLILLSCCAWSAWYGYATYAASSAIDDAHEAIEEATEAAAEAAESAETGGEASGNVCARAAECCEAYIGEMGAAAAGLSVESTCANYRNLASVAGSETGCQSAIDGYRSGLTAMNKTVPSACQ